MQGRGLAVAWGLLGVLLAGTVAWLALTEESGNGRTAIPAVVTVAVPPFPEPPEEETERTAATLPEPIVAEAEPETGTAPPEATLPEGAPPEGSLPETASPEVAEPASVEPRPAPDPAETIAETVRETPVPNEEIAAESRRENDSGEEPPATPVTESSVVEPAPPAEAAGREAEPGEPERTSAEAEPLRGATESPAQHQSSPEAPGEGQADQAATVETIEPTAPVSPDRQEAEPATTEARTDDQPTAGDQEGQEPLPPTVEVGALRPIPGEVLQPLRPPKEPSGDPALTEKGPFGPLPAISEDGRRAWKAYSRPFTASKDTARIAVVIGNLGLAEATTERAINELPPEVTLSFAPYADNVAGWVAKARAAGHEVLLDLPMEPIDYPKNDPGPKALFTSLELEQNFDRLQWVLSRASGYVGVTNYMGSRFTTSPEALRPVLEALRDRGLLFLDSRAAARSLATTMASEVDLPRAVNDRFIDVKASRAAIDRRLNELVEIARRNGAAVGIGYPYPVTIDRVKQWAAEIQKRDGMRLAPVSAVVGLQADR